MCDDGINVYSVKNNFIDMLYTIDVYDKCPNTSSIIQLA